MSGPAAILRGFPGKFVPLLVILLLIQVASPLVGRSPAGSFLLWASFLVACIPAVQPTLRLRAAATVGLVAVVAMRSAVLVSDAPSPSLRAAALLATAAYGLFIAVNILVALVRHSRVTTDTVLGAVCVYLLMAHVFALVFFALEVSQPGSIAGVRSGVAGGSAPDELQLATFIYFSTVSLTTMGYGDLVPVSPIARSLVTLEAMCGQFFVAVFVARMVGSMGPPLRSAERSED